MSPDLPCRPGVVDLLCMGAGARRWSNRLRQSLDVVARRWLDVVVQRVRDAGLGGDCYLYSSGMPCWAENAGVRVH